MNSWRVALRMARRDLARDRGRAWFVSLMIFLPVTAIVALHVIISSTQISDTEWLDLELGSAQAMLTQTGSAFTPSFSNPGSSISGEEAGTARAVPGWGEGVQAQASALGALLDRQTTAVTRSSFTVGPAAETLTAMGVDFGTMTWSNFVQRLHGAAPHGATEALVTPAGIKAGLPASGTATVTRTDGTQQSLTIVGTAEANVHGSVAHLITGLDKDREATHFFVFGGAPIGWDEAVRLAAYGFEVTSRELHAHPPQGFSYGDGDLISQFLFGLITLAALLLVALAVWPAFAIGAARQRRALALAASNGATTGHLRRVSLGQALLLGLVATSLGVAAGLGLGALGTFWLTSDRTQLHGPLEFPIGQIVLAGVGGLGAAVIAALATSRGLGRLDLVSIMRGSVRPAPVRARTSWLGGGLAVAGITGVWLALNLPEQLRFWGWTAAALTALTGSLLVVPAVLNLLARAAGGLPIPVRMGLRDSSRQHGRATSAVAAVLAGGLILTALWTVTGSTEADQLRRYRPYQAYGQASLSVDSITAESLAAARAAVAAVDPSLQLVYTARVGGYGEESYSIEALRGHCDVAGLDDSGEGCGSLGSSSRYGSDILTGSVDDLTTAFGLDAAQSRALRAGTMLVDTDPPQATTAAAQDEWAVTEIVDGKLRFAQLKESGTTVVSVPAMPVSTELINRAATHYRVGALLSDQAAKKLGWTSPYGWLQIIDPAGSISTETEAKLAVALKPWSQVDRLSVERGYEAPTTIVQWLITGILVLVSIVVAAIAAVMFTGELRPFLGTFIAVGAPPAMSRRLAAVQAALLTGIGTVLGTGIGAAVAAPLAASTTVGEYTENPLPPVVSPPWLLMAAVVVVVPLIASAIAAISTPAHQVLTKRTT